MNKKNFIKKYGSLMICWASIIVVTICEMIEQNFAGWSMLFAVFVNVVTVTKNHQYEQKEYFDDETKKKAFKSELMGKYGTLAMWIIVLILYAGGFMNGKVVTLSTRAWILASIINIVVLSIDIKINHFE